MSRLDIYAPPRRRELVLDFDIENRPLTYAGRDFTFSEVTAIAASFHQHGTMYCWLLGACDPVDMLEGFRGLYDQADVVTGHYIRNHDLPIIQGAMLEYGLAPLGPKLTSCTKNDLLNLSGVSKSQESLADMLGVPAPKIGMSQASWREANRLTPAGLDLTERRVTGDVRQHQQLRAELVRRGLLKPPRVWGKR